VKADAMLDYFAVLTSISSMKNTLSKNKKLRNEKGGDKTNRKEDTSINSILLPPEPEANETFSMYSVRENWHNRIIFNAYWWKRSA
jgi:hypothetical protein